AMDLMGRKIVVNKGCYFELFAGEIADFITQNQQEPALAEFLPSLAAALERLADVTELVIEAAGKNPAEIGAAAVDYLDLFGLTAQAYLWARMVQVAAPKAAGDSTGFYSAKLKTARFFYQRQLPQSLSLAEAIRNGSDCMMDVAAGEF
ncbi:MAG: acyl-CoA dehydrogenase, partial [Halomonadaceae bacterium]